MQRECRRAYNSYMYRMIHEPYENGKKKKFFRHVKSLRVDHCGVPVLIKDGIKHTTNQAKANVLNYRFSSVFTHDEEATLPDMPYETTGLDCIPAKVLKK